MSEPQESLDIGVLKDAFLECPVCLCHYDQTEKVPRLLSACLHAFCTVCLCQLLAKERNRQITCPLCRIVQKLSGGVLSLTIDPVRNKLVEYVEVRKKKSIPCTDCPDGYDAEFRCQECSVYLCKECTHAHRRNKLSRDHQVLTMKDMRDQPLTAFTKTHFCPLHPKHQIEFHCTTDGALCCLSCTVLEHQGHRFQKVENAWVSKKKDLESGLQSLRIKKDVLQDELEKERDWIGSLQSEQSSVTRKIDNMFNQLSKLVKERRDQVSELTSRKGGELVASATKRASALEQSLGMMQSTEEYLEHTIDKSDAVETIQVYQSLMQCLKGFTNAQQTQIPDMRSKIQFFPSLATAIGDILPLAGLVLETDTTSKDTVDHALFVSEVVKKVVECKTRQELFDKISSVTGETMKPHMCSKCKSATIPVTRVKCRHTLCILCFRADANSELRCPVCQKDVSVMIGDSPSGVMKTRRIERSLPGFQISNTIEIQYQIPDGLWKSGQAYQGIDITAFLPDTTDGRYILALLRVAWERRLTFEFNFSWMEGGRTLQFRIPHKTRYNKCTKSKDSFPDPRYFDDLRKKLAELRVTDDDVIDAEHLFQM